MTWPSAKLVLYVEEEVPHGLVVVRIEVWPDQLAKLAACPLQRHTVATAIPLPLRPGNISQTARRGMIFSVLRDQLPGDAPLEGLADAADVLVDPLAAVSSFDQLLAAGDERERAEVGDPVLRRRGAERGEVQCGNCGSHWWVGRS